MQSFLAPKNIYGYRTVRQPLCSICTFRLRLGCRFRKAGYQAIDRICDYYYSLQERPVTSQVEPGYLRKALPRQLSPFLEIRSLANYSYYSASAPDVGEDFQFVADDYQRLILPGGHIVLLPFDTDLIHVQS